MSAAQARMFIERVHRDAGFRARVMALADVDERMALIRGEGFDCSAAEISGLLDRLGDARLEAVGGGLMRPPHDEPGGGTFCDDYGTW
jgi:predicted ribosomally synthesized peptide with nif11-like leader